MLFKTTKILQTYCSLRSDFHFMCLWSFACMYIWGSQTPWNWSSTQLWTAGNWTRSFRRASSALTCWAISPTPERTLLPYLGIWISIRLFLVKNLLRNNNLNLSCLATSLNLVHGLDKYVPQSTCVPWFDYWGVVEPLRDGTWWKEVERLAACSRRRLFRSRFSLLFVSWLPGIEHLCSTKYSQHAVLPHHRPPKQQGQWTMHSLWSHRMSLSSFRVSTPGVLSEWQKAD